MTRLEMNIVTVLIMMSLYDTTRLSVCTNRNRMPVKQQSYYGHTQQHEQGGIIERDLSAAATIPIIIPTIKRLSAVH